MSRTFLDDGLMQWEAFASTGDYGFPARSRLVFLCLSDPGRRARYVSHAGDKADTERVLQDASPAELAELLRNARELS
ncbi:MAG: hypothetical protein ACRELV_12925 [Longimicrobiales bacterium]